MIANDTELVGKLDGPGLQLSIPFLEKFLTARKGDVDEAYKQFKETAMWRYENNIDFILDTPFIEEEGFKYATAYCYHGEDKNGWPLYIERTGEMKIDYLFDILGREGIIKSHVRHDETLAKLSRESSARKGQTIFKNCSIYDLTGFSFYLSSREIEGLKFISQLDSRYYPETLGITYVVNAPWLAQFAWSLIKGFLDPVVRSKVIMLGSDYKERLVEVIDPKYLPIEYGGICTCCDSNCPGGLTDGSIPHPGYTKNEPKPKTIKYTEEEFEFICVKPKPSRPSFDKLQVRTSFSKEFSPSSTAIPSTSVDLYFLPKKAPAWLPDEKTEICMNKECKAVFGTFNRKHHCRLCGDIFCDACTQKRRKLPFSGTNAQRVCDSCNKKVDLSLKNKKIAKAQGLEGISSVSSPVSTFSTPLSTELNNNSSNSINENTSNAPNRNWKYSVVRNTSTNLTSVSNYGGKDGELLKLELLPNPNNSNISPLKQERIDAVANKYNQYKRENNPDDNEDIPIYTSDGVKSYRIYYPIIRLLQFLFFVAILCFVIEFICNNINESRGSHFSIFKISSFWENEGNGFAVPPSTKGKYDF